MRSTSPAQAAPQPAVPVPLAGSYFELRRDYDAVRSAPGGITPEFVARVEAYVAKTKDSTDDNDIRGAELLSDGYLALGKLDQALATFKEYLGRVEQAHGRDEAAKRGTAKADQLFYRDKDYFTALSYYAWLGDLFRGTEHEEYAQFMVGRYLERTLAPKDAADEYEGFIEKFPQSKYARPAKQALYALYFNADRKADAVALLERYLAEYPDEDEACYAHFSLGLVYYGQGAAQYPAALAEFRWVTERHPENRRASSCRDMIAVIEGKVVPPGSPVATAPPPPPATAAVPPAGAPPVGQDLASVVPPAAAVPPANRPEAALQFARTTIAQAATGGAKKVTAEYAFTNRGQRPVKIVSLKSSCGCTVSRADQESYAPGAAGAITAEMDIGSFQGSVTKTVFVKTDEADGGNYVLHFTVDIPVYAAAAPAALRWELGKPPVPQTFVVQAGTDQPVRVTGVVCSVAGWQAAVATVTVGREYRVTVTPGDVSQPSRGLVMVNTDYPPAAPFRLTVRADVIGVRPPPVAP